jgi:hypothetical protein
MWLRRLLVALPPLLPAFNSADLSDLLTGLSLLRHRPSKPLRRGIESCLQRLADGAKPAQVVEIVEALARLRCGLRIRRTEKDPRKDRRILCAMGKSEVVAHS